MISKKNNDLGNTKNYYKQLFKNYKNKDALSYIDAILKSWSSIVKTGNITHSDKRIFDCALNQSNEYVLYEAGLRLIKLSKYNDEIKNIILDNFSARSRQARYNIVKISYNFDRN